MATYSNRKVVGIVICSLVASNAIASVDTIGPNGIKSAGLTTANGLPLNGGAVSSVNPVAIGQVESFRPGDPTFDTADATLYNSTVNPAGVFFAKPGPPITFNATANAESEIGPPPFPLPSTAGQHAVEVAGVMISTATDTPPTASTPTGVATAAHLYSIGVADTTDLDQLLASAAQHLRTGIPGVQVRAINFSFGLDLGSDDPDGRSLLTSFVDWSAHEHDVLYVVAGNAVPSNPIPTDNFNGITVASSEQVGGFGIYNRVSLGNLFSEDASGDRTSIDILAPGEIISVPTRGDSRTFVNGTSFAAPHVTATVALLQQYANERIVNAGWNAVNSRRHEVMKAVIMNSADKILDDGTVTIPGDAQPAPVGTFLSMERTVFDSGPDEDGMNRQNWLESEAYGDDYFSGPSFIALDDQMGAGHLNAKRAVQQFAPGEHDSDGTPVPAIGWDYGHTTGLNAINKYMISQSLLGGSFISVTMAWDRGVELNDTNSNNLFDHGESFEPYTDLAPHADDVINDLDLYLVPAGLTIDDAIATSLSNDSTIEHMFFRIPTTGQYELWVNQFDSDLGDGQDYAIAWWALTQAATGDYSGNGTVGPEDYTVFRSNFGSTTNTAADGNGNGIIDAADYVIWRKNLPPPGSAVSIPEPNCYLLILSIAIIFRSNFRRRV